MVSVAGFEPAVSWSQATRFAKLSYTLMAVHTGVEPVSGDRQSPIFPLDEWTMVAGARVELALQGYEPWLEPIQLTCDKDGTPQMIWTLISRFVALYSIH